MKNKYFIFLALYFFIFSNCKKEEIKKVENSLISVSGTINVKKEGSLNLTSRVFITWALDEPSEYIFSEGKIDINNKTFEINIYDSLPEKAFINDDFGIGFIFVTNDQNITSGLSPSGTDYEQIIGAAGGYCLIFKQEENIAMDTVINWIDDFSKGYTVGKGIELPGTFDGFEPYDNSSVILIIDDLENIEFTNWS